MGSLGRNGRKSGLLNGVNVRLTGLTRQGDTVLDFTMGSGSTAIACINTNRNYIGFELDKHYCDIANERIQKALAGSDEKGL